MTGILLCNQNQPLFTLNWNKYLEGILATWTNIHFLTVSAVCIVKCHWQNHFRGWEHFPYCVHWRMLPVWAVSLKHLAAICSLGPFCCTVPYYSARKVAVHYGPDTPPKIICNISFCLLCLFTAKYKTHMHSATQDEVHRNTLNRPGINIHPYI